jgi:hypothetical protein
MLKPSRMEASKRGMEEETDSHGPGKWQSIVGLGTSMHMQMKKKVDREDNKKKKPKIPINCPPILRNGIIPPHCCSISWWKMKTDVQCLEW